MTLTSAELTAMRSLADDHLPDLCTIVRSTPGHTATGAPTLTWATLASNVACRLDEPISASSESVVQGAVGSVVRWPMHFKYDQDLLAKDRVILNSVTYEIAEVLNAASWLITRRAIVVRVV